MVILKTAIREKRSQCRLLLNFPCPPLSKSTADGKLASHFLSHRVLQELRDGADI